MVDEFVRHLCILRRSKPIRRPCDSFSLSEVQKARMRDRDEEMCEQETVNELSVRNTESDKLTWTPHS